MKIYIVLLINVSNKQTKIKKVYKTFEEAKKYILEKIKPMLDDQDISWYRNHGSRRLESFENDLDKNWITKPFDIYKIEEHDLFL